MKNKKIAIILGTVMLSMNMAIPASAAEGEGAAIVVEEPSEESVVQNPIEDSQDTDNESEAPESEEVQENIETPIVEEQDLMKESNIEKNEQEGDQIEENETVAAEVNDIPDPAEKLPDNNIPYEVRQAMMHMRSGGDTNTPTTIAGSWIQEADGRWWYKHNNGSYTKNAWEYINGSWYHFDASGWMQTGWLKIGSTWYYLKSSGAMASGWEKVNDKWYYMDASGVMMTGWVSVGGKWYYMDTSGAMVTGTRVIDGVTYTFASSGEMTSSSASANKGKQIVDYAVQFVGNPYVSGGTSLTNGADCSGFVQSVFKHFGISLPRTTYEQVETGTSISVSNLQPGDLVFYYPGITHVGIYIGNNQIVHAANTKTGIVTSPLDWCGPVQACRRCWK